MSKRLLRKDPAAVERTRQAGAHDADNSDLPFVGQARSCLARKASVYCTGGSFVITGDAPMRHVPTSKIRGCGAAAAFAACVFAMLSADSARAADLIGLYLGGAVGQSRIEADGGGFARFSGDSFSANHSAFKVMAGVRPISPIGAEFEYIDFGHPSASLGGAPASATLSGAALFGVFYLPLPVVDVFAKAGFARLQSTVDGFANILCPVSISCSQAFRLDRTDTRFAAGGGLQFKFGALAVRGEYERFDAAGGHPSLLSIGAIWTFL